MAKKIIATLSSATMLFGLFAAVPALAVTTPVLTSLSVSPAFAKIDIGTTQQLTAFPKDQNGAAFSGATVNWSSSDTSIATVSSTGLVSGVSHGRVTITATAVAGNVAVTGTSIIKVNEHESEEAMENEHAEVHEHASIHENEGVHMDGHESESMSESD